MNMVLSLIIYSPYLAALPILYITYRYLKEGNWSLEHSWTNGLLFLFFWSVLVGFANDQGIYITSSLFLLGYFFLSMYLQEKYQREDAIENLLSSLFFLSLGSAFIAFLDKIGVITYDPAWWKFLIGTRSIVDIGDYQNYRVSGTFNNPNLAGTWYAIMVLIGYYFLQKKSGLTKWVYALCMMIFALTLMITESRGAVIGLFLGFVIYSYFSGHKKKMLFLMFLLLGSIALMLHRPDWFPRGEILFSSIRDRQAIWINTFEMFLKKPVTGWGLLGIYFADRSIYDYLRVFHAHNILLTLATTLGVVGLFTFFYMKWSLLQEIRILYQANCRLTPLLSGMQAMILGQGVFDFTIMSPQIGVLFIASAAMIGGLARTYRPIVGRTIAWQQGKYKKA
ncbi:O-antigen ligase [Ammoniphilus sp. YIM 78166]|uniref:O-antigen ligase family protein n=1 Tax=Ammoniphilus sp. YIM 78166 TaxID=1644106 RepID=UPI00106F36B0|nr:O-antigen ligase family protein [Ammoniphilus sp. YIM 78166]